MVETLPGECTPERENTPSLKFLSPFSKGGHSGRIGFAYLVRESLLKGEINSFFPLREAPF